MKNLVKFLVVVVAVCAVGAAYAGERGNRGNRGERGAGGALPQGMLDRLKENAPEDIKALIDKAAGGAQLTAEENQKIRDYARQTMGDRMQGMRDAPADIRAIMEKRRNNQELTAEEQAKLDAFRQQGAAARAEPAPDAARPARAMVRMQAPVIPRVEVNHRDAAILRIAEIQYKQGKHQDALTTLAGVVKDSPQPEAVAAARLAAGRIYRLNLLLPDKAASEFLAVRGALADTAIREMAEMYEQSGEPETAVALLKAELEKAATPADKLVFLTGIVDVYDRAGQTENALATLNEIVTMIKYDEAMKLPMAKPANLLPNMFPGFAR